MIGDDVRDDIGGAQNIGIQGILVRTGKYTSGDESKHGIKPHFVADSFVEAVDYLLNPSSRVHSTL
jgi:ribonucleotide monophosphatase NagD (HAD superfamily)